MQNIRISTRFLGHDIAHKVEALLPHARETLKTVASKNCRGAEWTGWWNFPQERGFSLFEQMQTDLQSLKVDYDCVVVIGIGGSYLGTRTIEQALSASHANSPKPIYYCGHHLSTSDHLQLFKTLSTHKPLVCVVSKSGTTTEPGIAFRFIYKWLKLHFAADCDQRVVAITDPESGALRKMATSKGWLTFPIPSDVGGRFSVLTPVSIAPLFLAGYDVQALLKGADHEFAALTKSLENTTDYHPALYYAALRFILWQQGKRIEVTSVVEPKLHSLCEWWKQLFGESEGKNHLGLFPASLIFTTDLHSLGQYAQDGARTLFETFLTFDNRSEPQLTIPHDDDDLDGLNYLAGQTMSAVNHAAMQATLLAHFDGQVPCVELAFPKLNSFGLGQCFAFYQTACAVSALLLELNPFDQPGVEDYKVNLFALMGKKGFAEQGKALRERLGKA